MGDGKLKKIPNLVQNISIGVAILPFIGFGIGTLETAPPYTVVLVDDAAKTIFAPQCAKEWQSRPTTTSYLLRRTTMAEANQLHYKLDYECKETGVFSEDGPSLTGLLLIKLGILSPPKHWWDMPYRTEEGVVYPGHKKPN